MSPPAWCWHLIHALPFPSHHNFPSLCAHTFLPAQLRLKPDQLLCSGSVIYNWPLVSGLKRRPAALRLRRPCVVATVWTLAWWLEGSGINSSLAMPLSERNAVLPAVLSSSTCRSFQPRPRRLLSADGKVFLNLWFIPHPSEVLVMFKTLPEKVCII